MKLAHAVGWVCVAMVSYAAGHWWSQPVTQTPVGRKILYYQDPMHPAYRSNKPGIAPDCGMQLVPIYEAKSVDNPVAPAGAVHISPDRQQLIGVRTTAARREATSRPIRMPGRVTVDETRVYPIRVRAEGWVRKIFPNTTGAHVREGQRLVTIYGREYKLAQQAYIYALGSLERLQKSADAEPLNQAKLTVAESRAALENLGIGKALIEEIGLTRLPQIDVQLVSPIDGFILARNVFANQKLEPGTELYRIVDLRHVWIEADLISDDSRFVHAGDRARISPAADPHTALLAQVSDVLPRIDAETRRLKVRFEIDNPDFALRPDMLVDVELQTTLPSAVTIPADAVIDGGLTRTVFVDRGNGFFEPREVQTGWRSGNLVEIVKGVEPGEQVVSSGTFLVHSESRLQRIEPTSAMTSTCDQTGSSEYKADPGGASAVPCQQETERPRERPVRDPA